MVNFASSLSVFWNYRPVQASAPQTLAPLTVTSHTHEEYDANAQHEATVLANDFVQRLQRAQLLPDSGSSYAGGPFLV